MSTRYAVAFSELIDIFPDLLHDPRHLVTLVDFDSRNEMIRRLPVPRVTRTADDFDEDLVWSGLWNRDFEHLAPQRMCFDNH
jgi:hypothetical protein